MCSEAKHLTRSASVLLWELLNVFKTLSDGRKEFGETFVNSTEKPKYLVQYSSHLALEISIHLSQSE